MSKPFAVATTVLLSLACGGVANRPPASPAVPHPVGERISVGDLEVEVHVASRADRVGGRFVNYAAAEGSALQIVDVSVKNDGNQPAAMVGRFVLLEGERLYRPTSECQIAMKDNWHLLEGINPGVRRRGKVCFEVPKEMSDLQFGVKAGLLSRPEIFAL